MEIIIVGIGPDVPGMISRRAYEMLCSGIKVIVRSQHYTVIKELIASGIAVEALDELYQSSDDFDELNREIARRVVNSTSVHGSVAYAVLDAASDAAVCHINDMLPEGASIRIIPSVSIAEYALAQARYTVNSPGIKILSAADILTWRPEAESVLVVTEISSRYIASEWKLALLEYYPHDFMISFTHAENAVEVPLAQLDMQQHYDHITAMVIPRYTDIGKRKHTFSELVDIVKALRDPYDGCPWDRVQTHDSLRRYLIEESYEVLDAIYSGDDEMLTEELGDVLLQVVLHSEIGRQRGEFDIMDVISAISKKMINRHPHLFGEKVGMDDFNIENSWESIKMREKGINSIEDNVRLIPKSLPALMRMAKVVKKSGDYFIKKAAHYSNTAEMAKIYDAGVTDEEFKKLVRRILLGISVMANQRGIELETQMQKAIDDYVEEYAGGAGVAFENP